MEKEALHPSDQDLLRTVDGELPTRRAAQVRAHLAACWTCRARVAEIETTIADFVRVNRQDTDPQPPPISGPRALLKARMAEAARIPHRSRWRQLSFGMNPKAFAYVMALALLIGLGGRILYLRATGHEFSNPGNVYAASLPNPKLTPGSTRALAFADLCSTGHDEVIRAVPNRLQQDVFREYGIAGARAADYEVDYLITPGLGGSDDIRNLWPEPHYNTEWNSYVKDQLEDHLHRLVCGGEVGLAAAQQDIAGNWIFAYKKYFHTDKPLSNYSTSRAPASATLAASGTLFAIFQL
jgi:hypothetical protein